jgi:Ser/Thr protein kinase RdoA (MazF antagonist)
MTMLTKKEILKKYHVNDTDFLNGGIESSVYALNEKYVLKLYNTSKQASYLLELKDFYSSLNRSLLPYEIPTIEYVGVEEPYCVTIEKMLTGTRLSTHIHNRTQSEIMDILGIYLETQLHLQKIKFPKEILRYKLFDEENISDRMSGDWNQFMVRLIDHQARKPNHLLESQVDQYKTKIDQLISIFNTPYRGEYTLIHGDFYPGNILVDDSLKVTALLDFGLFTMFGDPLYDIATGWVFFDMYNELGMDIRNKYLSLLLRSLGDKINKPIRAYVLVYSLISCEIYPLDIKRDHFNWCVQNLNDQELLDGLL